MGAFSESLAPLRAKMARRYSAVRPVSRVWFELTDKAAFEQCVQLCLKWMEPRSQVKFSPEAWSGKSFDVTDVLGANPAKAIRVDATDGAIWVARLDFPDPRQPRTWISEFFTEQRMGALCRFGAQLTCVIREEFSSYDITRPTVVRHVLENLSAEADSWPLADTAIDVDSADVTSFEELLYNPTRRLPVIAISESEDGTCRIAPNELARHVAGAAHIAHLSKEASWELTRAIGKRMSVFNGAVRLYLPGLSEEVEDPYQHPLWLSPNEDSRFVQAMAGRVLPFAFLREQGPSDFPKYSVVREFLARNAFTHRRASSQVEQARDEVEVLKIELSEMTEERESWQSLAQEEQNKRLSAEAEIERLKAEQQRSKAEISRLAAKAATLQHRIEEKSTALVAEDKADRPLISYDELEDWAEEVLGESIYIHPAAAKDCRKNGHGSMLSKIAAALVVIRDNLVPFKVHGGLERRNLAREKLLELGFEDTPCFANRDEAERTVGYSVRYEGKIEYLYDHLKFGNGYNNANQIRIYYFWDEARKRFVVGKMPSHLRNNLTT